MNNKTLTIKNMVCPRCIRVVREELETLGHEIQEIRLGEVVLKNEPADMPSIAKVLEVQGFALLEERNARLINQVKTYILEQIQAGSLEQAKFNLSTRLESQFNISYSHMSAQFSQLESQTLEHYFIAQKIEFVKEWLAYEELTLGEMAHRLGYSSVAHLSHQFKKNTGFSPSEFKKLKGHKRKALSEL